MKSQGQKRRKKNHHPKKPESPEKSGRGFERLARSRRKRMDEKNQLSSIQRSAVGGQLNSFRGEDRTGDF
jgi:hypothetical protein